MKKTDSIPVYNIPIKEDAKKKITALKQKFKKEAIKSVV